jgi:hypothetical protein
MNMNGETWANEQMSVGNWDAVWGSCQYASAAWAFNECQRMRQEGQSWPDIAQALELEFTPGPAPTPQHVVDDDLGSFDSANAMLDAARDESWDLWGTLPIVFYSFMPGWVVEGDDDNTEMGMMAALLIEFGIVSSPAYFVAFDT